MTSHEEQRAGQEKNKAWFKRWRDRLNSPESLITVSKRLETPIPEGELAALVGAIAWAMNDFAAGSDKNVMAPETFVSTFGNDILQRAQKQRPIPDARPKLDTVMRALVLRGKEE